MMIRTTRVAAWVQSQGRTHRLARGLALGMSLAITLGSGGCVVAYDPWVREPGPGTTQAELAGQRPAVRAARWTPPAKEVASAKPAATSRTTQPETSAKPPPEKPLAEKPVPEKSASDQPAPAPAVAVPAGVAARELQWFVGVLSGDDIAPPRGDRVLESHFDAEFLKKVPLAQLRSVVSQWRRDELGGGAAVIESVRESSPQALEATIRGERTGRLSTVRLRVNDEGKIAGLVIAPLIGVAKAKGTWEELDAKLAAAVNNPGNTNSARTARLGLGAYELVSGSEPAVAPKLVPIHELDADTPLAIGSSFKLYVLGALGELVAEKKAAWDEKLAVRDELKSLPSGRMQMVPAREDFALSYFADQMISISDNTATDHLLARVGRENVEAYMARTSARPELNRPLLSTMEMFKIKLGADRGLAARYAAASEADRRAMLKKDGDVERQTPSLRMAQTWNLPYAIDTVEWFASSRDLATLMADLRRQERQPDLAPLGAALRINPGLPLDGQTWTSIAYKGGSEPGVLNMTWLLQRVDGRWFVLTMTWNDSKRTVEQRAFTDLVSEALGLLAGYQRQP